MKRHVIIAFVGTGRLGLGILAIPASVLVTLTVINAFNFIDGIDGLAPSMALIASDGPPRTANAGCGDNGTSGSRQERTQRL
jgi:hypothetical protein